jgi:hypothetical protein
VLVGFADAGALAGGAEAGGLPLGGGEPLGAGGVPVLT